MIWWTIRHLRLACISHFTRFLFFLIIVITVFPSASSKSEGDALQSFRSRLFDPYNVLGTWDLHDDPCIWFHVTCDQENHVIRVDLGNANLSGHLVPELGNLQHLQYLELFENNISGEIPEELGKLKDLVSLDLYNNNLTGKIPESLGCLESLAFLRLNDNHLTGPIPLSLTEIRSLKVIDFSNNNLCGIIPTSGSFKHFTLKSFENNPRLHGPKLPRRVAHDSGCK